MGSTFLSFLCCFRLMPRRFAVTMSACLDAIPEHQIFCALLRHDAESRPLVEAQGRVFLLDGEGHLPIFIFPEQAQKSVQQLCPDPSPAILRQ